MSAIETALTRVSRLYASTDGGDPAELALAAGFRMDASGRVSSISRRSNRVSSFTPTSRRSPTSEMAAAPRSGVSSSEADGGNIDIECNLRRGGVSPRSSPPLPPRSKEKAPGSVEWGPSSGKGDAEMSRTNPSDEGSVLLFSTLGTPEEHVSDAFGSGSSVVSGPLTFSASNFASPIARPLLLGRLAVREGYGLGPVGSAGWLGGRGLVQAWFPRGWRHFSGVRGSASPFVLFAKSEWGKMREWRRSGYTEDDIDPTMSACYFSKPANSTGRLKQFDADGINADLQEMELINTIKSIRERR